MTDTIFALASGAGRAGVAVLRVSGPAAGSALARVTRAALPPPRRAARRRFYGAQEEDAIDDGLALWFPAPHSFTGENVAEIHLHGGRAVLLAILASLGHCDGLRPAEPGEFTRRAFANGKLDLTAAEGLADLVAAETEAQRRQAFRQLEGELARLYDGWRQTLIENSARLEAAIDFPEEGLPADLVSDVTVNILGISAEISQHLVDNRRGERLREGFSVAIIGATNVGKSSLLNLLARREAAIVSATAGTTRDVVEVHLDLGGYPVILADTAGLRDAADAVEIEGVRRAIARAATADLKIALFDATSWPDVDARTRDLVDADTMVVVNKSDLAPVPGDAAMAGRQALAVSLKTGTGVEAFLQALAREVDQRLAGNESAPVLTRVRHRHALEACHEALARSVFASAPELMAEDLRLALRALGRITGRVDVEDILDAIFREFCIGK